MTWQEFKKYIQEKYLVQENFSSEIKLNQTAKHKFSSANTKELEQALIDLFLSIDNYFEYSDDRQFHDLPALQDYFEAEENGAESSDDESDNDINNIFVTKSKTKSSTEPKQNKTWKELFPEREEIFFGKINNDAPCNPTVWNALSQIYTEWSTREVKTQQLKSQSGQWGKQFEKLMMEYFATKAQKYIKKKGLHNLKAELKQWLTDYESLDKESQQELKSNKEDVQKVYNLLSRKGATNQSSQEITNPVNNWDWNTVFKYSVAGLVILLGISLILKLVKGK